MKTYLQKPLIMHRFLAPLFLICALLLLTPYSSQSQNSNHIGYDANRQLTWSDFKGRPDKKHEAHALTSYEIMFSSSYDGETGEMKFVVSCVFVKNKSWVKKDPTDHLLKHEQGHFDIAEIYTRKLREELSKVKFNPKTVEKEVGKIYDKVMQESQKRQRQYDKETNHSLIEEKQAEWNKIIEKELKASKAFQSTSS